MNKKSKNPQETIVKASVFRVQTAFWITCWSSAKNPMGKVMIPKMEFRSEGVGTANKAGNLKP